MYFRGPEVVAFRSRRDGWPAFVERVLVERAIDGIFLFGDSRPHHAVARQVAKLRGIAVFVFEEGYLRPDHVTLERDGVNGNSRMPRDPEVFRRSVFAKPAPDIVPVGTTFRYGAWYATAYSVALTLGLLLYPFYRHHRPLNAWLEAYRWVLSGLRKLVYERREATLWPQLIADHDRRYFLVPLQVHCDAQLGYARFASIEQFIEEVVASFAAHAPADTILVIKHHPMDRAYREYSPLVRTLATRHGLGRRLLYLHDVNLPRLLRHARGVICINSTVGLQAVQYGTPVKTLGSAVYDLPGLTAQNSIEEFWQRPEAPDPALYNAFRDWLLHVNQANGNFYRRLAGATRFTGVAWFDGPRAPEDPRPPAADQRASGAT